MRLSIPPAFKSAVNFDDWTLYHLPDVPGGSFLWQRFKLMLSPERAPARRGQTRAFRLSWNPLEQRFAKDGPATRLERELPLLYDLVEYHMSQAYPRDWLTERALYDPSEIDAEIARLKAARTARARASRPAGRG